MLEWVRLRIDAAMRTAMLSAAAAMLLFIGVALLVIAGTVALAAAYGTIEALALVGGGFVAAGLAVLLYARSLRARAARRTASLPLGALAQAFAVGLAAGKAARR